MFIQKQNIKKKKKKKKLNRYIHFFFFFLITSLTPIKMLPIKHEHSPGGFQIALLFILLFFFVKVNNLHLL